MKNKINVEIDNGKSLVVKDYAILENDPSTMNYDSLPQRGDLIFKAIIQNNAKRKIKDFKYELRTYDVNDQLIDLIKQTIIEQKYINKNDDLSIISSFNTPPDFDKLVFKTNSNSDYDYFKYIYALLWFFTGIGFGFTLI